MQRTGYGLARWVPVITAMRVSGDGTWSGELSSLFEPTPDMCAFWGEKKQPDGQVFRISPSSATLQHNSSQYLVRVRKNLIHVRQSGNSRAAVNDRSFDQKSTAEYSGIRMQYSTLEG